MRTFRRVQAELCSFGRVFMLTLTVDPELFPKGPEDAYRYCREKSVVKRTVDRLWKWGCLNSRRWFVCLEFQGNGWPHFHVLVDASFIPFEKLAEAWNRNWGAWKDRLADGRPGFGSVRFSSSGDRRKAARYTAGYLMKAPKPTAESPSGFPEWLLGFRGQVRRWSCSRDFWTGDRKAEPGNGSELSNGGQRRRWRTIAERLESCGSTSVICREVEVVDAAGEVVQKWEFVGVVESPLWMTMDEMREGDALWESAITDGKAGFVVSSLSDVNEIRRCLNWAPDVDPDLGVCLEMDDVPF